MSLNATMSFDHVIEVHDDGSITDRCDIYAPECFDDGYANIDFAGDNRWTALNGYSGQYGYAGPIMHASELIGGQMAEDIIGEPGVYVAVAVYDLDDDEPSASGWAVLRLNACGEES